MAAAAARGRFMEGYVVIDLYMSGTGNGQRAAIALEEAGLPYRVRKLNLAKGEQKSPEFLAINPAGAIPAIVDNDAAGGKPLNLSQSAAIILYAAEKSGKLLPKDPGRRAQALQWLMQAASDCSGTSATIFVLGNMAPDKSQANVEFFEKRLLKFFGDCDRQLQGKDFLAGELSAADLALYPVVAARRALIDKAEGLADLKRWANAMGARPAIQKGMAAGT